LDAQLPHPVPAQVVLGRAELFAQREQLAHQLRAPVREQVHQPGGHGRLAQLADRFRAGPVAGLAGRGDGLVPCRDEPLGRHSVEIFEHLLRYHVLHHGLPGPGRA
jgi:hypothetical protein